MTDKPKAKSSLAERELDKAQEQFDSFDSQVKEMSLDKMNEAPKQEIEPQTKLSQSEIEKSQDIYLKPIRTHASREKFNEKYREDYNFQKEYVYFIAENHEAIGESIDIWTKPFPGVPAEEWMVPCNKPVWGPRYLAEQITKARYHILSMDQSKMTSVNQFGQEYGQIVVKSTKQRLDALPATKRKSIFMGNTF
jgi:hypothetical protein